MADDRRAQDWQEGIYAPSASTSRMDYRERHWIEFVNNVERWKRKNRHNYLQVCKDVHALLKWFFDAVELRKVEIAPNQYFQFTEESKIQALNAIADKLEKMAGETRLQIRPNVRFSLDANPNSTDAEEWISSIPFLVPEPARSNLSGVYVSLALFLGGPSAHKLRRCPYCSSLFLRPKGYKNKYCPGTNHRDLFQRRERVKSGFHTKDMAERRNPESVKFDPKYIR
ncbi:MAG: hypothetical protein O2954_15175 [bacterium]|nr:hypothetical protein [bacterium]